MEDKEEKRIVKMDYPSNSKLNKEEKEEKKVEKIISGSVVTRKKSLGKRFKELFFGEEVGSVSLYILHDVLIPAAKATISDMLNGGLDMLFFGEGKRGSRTIRDRGKSYVSYDKHYNDNNRDREKREISSRRDRARHNFDDIILDTRGEAEEVLSHLVDLTIDYDTASVADLYDLVGIPTNFTDNKWGWEDLSGATVSRVRDGYLVNLPKVILID